MRIAWCTPLARRSGISKYSLAVLPALARLADVTVFAEKTGDDYEPECEVRDLNRLEAAVGQLEAFDMVVYNSGNNPAFHAEIHRAYERVPGIVVVHDKRMHGFFHDLWAVLDKDPARYAAMMRHYYGEAGEDAAAQVLSGKAGVDSFSEYPLIEPAIWNATGIIVHSRETASRVARYGDLIPVETLALPFDPGCLGLLPRSSDEPSIGRERVHLVSSGGVYEQKRIGSVIEAIAGDDLLRGSITFTAVGGGRAEYIDSMRSRAEAAGIGSIVNFTGWVDDDEMYRQIASADVAVNLRYPSMESSSLSLIEQMYFGKPVVVTDTSYYSELPETVALKVPIDGEVPALREALRRLVTDEATRVRMGAAAHERAVQVHNPETYAAEVVALAKEVVPEGAAS